MGMNNLTKLTKTKGEGEVFVPIESTYRRPKPAAGARAAPAKPKEKGGQ
jgi:hypothetical protein